MANRFPRTEMHVIDRSVPKAAVSTTAALHRPFFPIFAEKGRIGVPIEGSYTAHKAEFGERSFALTDKYYNHSTLFAVEAMKYQRIFLMRVASPSAKIGSMVLEAHVTYGPGMQVIQYERDASGNYILDANGAKQPLTKADGVTVLTEEGVKIKWMARPLASGEIATTINPVVTENADDTFTTVYPILVTRATSPGEFINYVGYKLYFDRTDDIAAMENVSSLFFRFAPVQKNATDGLVSPILNSFSNPSTYFSFQEGLIDPTYDRRMFGGDILDAQYVDNDNYTTLPFDYTFYGENAKAICDRIYALDKGLDISLTSPWMVNFLTLTNTSGYTYRHAVLDDAGLYLSRDVVQYHVGGDDGTLTKTEFEDLVEYYLSTDVFPQITDSARYPFSHIYDSGYRLQTKKFLTDLMSIRDDIKLTMSTQDVANPPNDKEEDYSTGSSLRSRILLHPESEDYGTQACRATITQQCGYLANSNYKLPVPTTLHIMIGRCMGMSTDRITKLVDCLDNGSAITVFKSISWLPTGDDHKQLSWDIGLNYVQAFDSGNDWHFAGLKSVYPIANSLLTDDVITDIIVFFKPIVRRQWARQSGSHEKLKIRFAKAKDRIEKNAVSAFGTNVRVEVTAYQTENDAIEGDVNTINAAIYGTMPSHVWKVLIPINREEA